MPPEIDAPVIVKPPPKNTVNIGESRRPTFVDGKTPLEDMSPLLLGTGKPIGTDNPANTTALNESRRELEALANRPITPQSMSSEKEFSETKNKLKSTVLKDGTLATIDDVDQNLIDKIVNIQPWESEGEYVGYPRTDQDLITKHDLDGETILIKRLSKTKRELEADIDKPEHRRDVLSNDPIAQIAIFDEMRQRYQATYGEDLPVEHPHGFFTHKDGTNYMIYRYQEPLEVNYLTEQGEKIIKESPQRIQDIKTRLSVIGVTGHERSEGWKVVSDDSTPDGYSLVFVDTQEWRIKEKYQNRLSNQDFKIKETPSDELILSREETETTVDHLRDRIAADPDLIKRRTRMLQELQSEGLQTEEVDGRTYVTLYRGIRPAWEAATTAAGFCKRTSSRTKLEQQLLKVNNTAELFGALSGDHIAESFSSLLIPTSFSESIARHYHNRDGLNILIKMRVPLEHIVPVYQYAEAHLNDSFISEKEIAVIGRIDPEWIQTLSN